jgi:hypothetical protein
MKKVLLLIVLSIAAAWLLWSASGPFVLARRLKMEVEPLQAEKRRLGAENRQFEQRLREMQTPEILQMEARRQGWIKPGERRLVFLRPPSQERMEPPAARKNCASLFSQARRWAQIKAAKLFHKPILED